MSSSLFKKGLAIVDADDLQQSKGKRKKTKSLNIPQHHRIELQSTKKTTVAEARKKLKNKNHLLNENLRKLKLLKEAGKIELNKDIRKLIIKRAVTKRTVKPSKTKKKQQKTAFTEEDFKTFEAEYCGE